MDILYTIISLRWRHVGLFLPQRNTLSGSWWRDGVQIWRVNAKTQGVILQLEGWSAGIATPQLENWEFLLVKVIQAAGEIILSRGVSMHENFNYLI
jgi:hypothetical protein